MDVFQLYKPFRNKVAALAVMESLYVVWAYCRALQFRAKFQFPSDIETDGQFLTSRVPQKFVAEWELETLAREIILNAQTTASTRRTLRSWSGMAGVINALRHLENEIYRLCSTDDQVLVELICIAHRQFIWQTNYPNGASAIRFFRIFDHPEIDTVCLARVGLTIREVYLCGMAILGHFMQRPVENLPLKSHFSSLSDDQVARFLAFTTRNLADMRQELRKEQQYNSKFAYAYGVLRARPLVTVRRGQTEVLLCPLPTLLFWRITGGLYYELVGDSRFSQPFGENFQRYVGEVAERACGSGRIKLLPEQRYGPKTTQRDTVDWILDDGDAALFLECKAKRLSRDAKTELDDLRPLDNDIEHMANAVLQVYRTASDYLGNQYPHFAFKPDRKIFPAVVTLENWHMFGPEMLSRLRQAVEAKLSASGMSPSLLSTMPYSVWSIEELERALQIVDSVRLLDFLDGKIEDKEMRGWEWAGYMTRRFGEGFARRNLFHQEYLSMFEGLTP
jgi:hypothetical protein